MVDQYLTWVHMKSTMITRMVAFKCIHYTLLCTMLYVQCVVHWECKLQLHVIRDKVCTFYMGMEVVNTFKNCSWLQIEVCLPVILPQLCVWRAT